MAYIGRILPAINLSDSSGIMNYGAFLGTSASSELVSLLSDQVGTTFFGKHYSDTDFMTKIIAPMKRAVEQIAVTAETLLNPDHIRPLIQMDDFLMIPPVMQLPILLYGPVRELFDRGRIEGFGYDPAYLPADDPYEHFLASGCVDDVGAKLDADGSFEMTWWMSSEDPDWSEEEKSSIRDTREAVYRMLTRTEFDPTSYPNIRG